MGDVDVREIGIKSCSSFPAIIEFSMCRMRNTEATIIASTGDYSILVRQLFMGMDVCNQEDTELFQRLTVSSYDEYKYILDKLKTLAEDDCTYILNELSLSAIQNDYRLSRSSRNGF